MEDQDAGLAATAQRGWRPDGAVFGTKGEALNLMKSRLPKGGRVPKLARSMNHVEKL
jgi:hypothetical protein